MDPRHRTGNNARLITRRFVLFIGSVLFFVHNDETNICRRSKERRAGADNHPRFPAANAKKSVVTLGNGQAAVDDDDVVREHRLKRGH